MKKRLGAFLEALLLKLIAGYVYLQIIECNS
jgi:hypothetical protein